MSLMAYQITSLTIAYSTIYLFMRRSKKTSKLRVAGLRAGNSPVTGEFPAQMASNAENVSIWWRHHGCQDNLKMKYGIKMRSYIHVQLEYFSYSRLWYFLCGIAYLKFDMVCYIEVGMLN